MEFAITASMFAHRCPIEADDSWLACPSFAGLRRQEFFVLHSLARAKSKGLLVRILLIALFGAAGTLARYGLQGVIQVRAGSAFPYGTLLVNLSGCFLLALIGQFTLNRLVISPD